jgi:hypothetical protein
MDCRDVRALTEAHLSEQLLVETTQSVLAHLERCPACRAEIDGVRRLRSATRSAFERAPDLAIRPAFRAALASRLQANVAHPPTVTMSRRGWLALAASAVLGAAWGWREWLTPRPTDLVHAATGDHQFCALTFKLTERPISLDEAARRYGDVYRSFTTMEVSNSPLSGGSLRILERHSCVFGGRRFVHLVLAYKQEQVSLLVTDDVQTNAAAGHGATNEPTPSSLPVTDGLHVAWFHGARHAVFVVSSLSDEDLQEVARALAGPVSRALSSA